MIDDTQLLHLYAGQRSEAAFAELVQRHLAMVYRSAARQLGPDSHLADDVAQSVFVLLARKSRSLLAHPSLTVWLHRTTRFKVSEALRAERRRRARDALALALQESIPSDLVICDWERLRPLIDEVLFELKESDREAVLLRFFEERLFADIATREVSMRATLGISLAAGALTIGLMGVARHAARERDRLEMQLETATARQAALHEESQQRRRRELLGPAWPTIRRAVRAERRNFRRPTPAHGSDRRRERQAPQPQSHADQLQDFLRRIRMVAGDPRHGVVAGRTITDTAASAGCAPEAMQRNLGMHIGPVPDRPRLVIVRRRRRQEQKRVLQQLRLRLGANAPLDVE